MVVYDPVVRACAADIALGGNISYRGNALSPSNILVLSWVGVGFYWFLFELTGEEIKIAAPVELKSKNKAPNTGEDLYAGQVKLQWTWTHR